MIRVAIIGAGIGAEHLAGYRALPDRFTVAALCDLDTERARKAAGDDASIAVTADLDGVLADPDIDLIDVCLPPHLHFPVSVNALEAGKHVICEKPIVTSLEEADRLIAAIDAAPGHFYPVFQYRFGPAMTALAALIESGLAGQPQVAALETHWNRSAAYYAVPWRGTWAGEKGGAVLGHAIHVHDLLCCLFGPVAEVSAALATRVNPIETEDCAAILMQFQNGALATSSVTLGSARDETRVRLVFEGLTATSGTAPYAPATGPWTFVARDPARQAEIDAIVASAASERMGFAGLLDAVADALDGRPSRTVLPEDGRRSIELVTAIYTAARSGGRVALPLAPGAPNYGGWQP
ncbi:Gfo/Idh/MocA family oxidoreductase [Rhodobacterales bacterium HKCCE3408]|nr:Gfo/Idh/MocA family oxidoreductase [Rhodobacterales bacterium HKCCE3408]